MSDSVADKLNIIEEVHDLDKQVYDSFLRFFTLDISNLL